MECETKTVDETSGTKNEFLKSLTNIYKTDFLSDITLRIIEDTTDETDRLNEEESNGSTVESCNKQVCLPVHKLVLCLNSKFFAKLLHETSMKEKYEKEIVLSVNPGDSEYVELLIHCFYDFDLLKGIGLFKLLKVLVIGDRYMCDALLKQGSAMVAYESVATIDECNSVLDCLAFYECSLGHVLSKDFFVSCCSKFLTNTFTPLECVVCGELPNKLHFSSLLMLLKSNDGFAFHENSVMTLVLNWLEADESRQTEQNIEALLAECRYEHMDVPFLTTVLSHTNPILCKWPGFLNWYVKAVAYPASANGFIKSHDRLDRSLKFEINKEKFSLFYNSIRANIRYFKYNKEIVFHRYNLQMNFNKATEKWTSDKWILYNGLILQPAIFLCGDENIVMLELYLGKDNQKRELSDFKLIISIWIGFSAKDHFDHIRRLEIEFLNSNRAEISIDYISQVISDECCYTCLIFF